MRGGSEVRSRGSVIHPTAIIHENAEIGEGVQIGPYVCIAGTVKIGSRTVVGPRVTIEGYTTLGADNEIFSGAVIGSPTQDRKFSGGVSYLKIGDRNKVREYVTINPGTESGAETLIGDDNLLMAYSHVAHDCIIRNHAVLANAATLGGHVLVDDRAIIGGLSAVHQFVRIGRLSLVGGCSKVVQDVPPFLIADGHPARVYGINSVGIDRAGISREEKAMIKKAFRIVFKSSLTVKDALMKLQQECPPVPSLSFLIEFLKASERGICR